MLIGEMEVIFHTPLICRISTCTRSRLRSNWESSIWDFSCMNQSRSSLWSTVRFLIGNHVDRAVRYRPAR